MFAWLSQEVLVDNIDISIITVPLLVFNLLFIGINIFILIMYLIVYPKTIQSQKKAKQRLDSDFFLKNAVNGYSGDPLFRQGLCSIIIPAHNEESVIKNTIFNCLLQTYTNIEIIPVCHNCKDSTFTRCKEMLDRRVRAFNLNTKESGKSIALNYGVKMSKGKYILILDADGRLGKNFIEDMLPMFVDKNYAAIQGKLASSNRSYNFLTRLLSLEVDLWSTPFITVRDFLIHRTSLLGTGYIIKKNILMKMGGFSNHLVDDFELTFRLLRKKYRIGFAPLSIIYDEKPPSLDLMFNQRGRWLRGFFDLLRHRIAEPKDILGNLVWVSPIANFTNMALLLILAYSSLHYLGFHYYPFYFSYIPFTIWLELIALNFLLNTFVLVKLYGKQGLKSAVLLPLFLPFSNYYLMASLKAFFIKSWAESKTTHGFRTEKEIFPTVNATQFHKNSILENNIDISRTEKEIPHITNAVQFSKAAVTKTDLK